MERLKCECGNDTFNVITKGRKDWKDHIIECRECRKRYGMPILFVEEISFR